MSSARRSVSDRGAGSWRPPCRSPAVRTVAAAAIVEPMTIAAAAMRTVRRRISAPAHPLDVVDDVARRAVGRCGVASPAPVDDVALVVAGAEAIVAAPADQAVLPLAADDDVAADAAVDPVGARPAVDAVVAAVAGDAVVARAADDRVLAGAAGHAVLPGAGVDGVVAAAAEDGVVTVEATDHV